MSLSIEEIQQLSHSNHSDAVRLERDSDKLSSGSKTTRLASCRRPFILVEDTCTYDSPHGSENSRDDIVDHDHDELAGLHRDCTLVMDSIKSTQNLIVLT